MSPMYPVFGICSTVSMVYHRLPILIFFGIFNVITLWLVHTYGVRRRQRSVESPADTVAP